MKNKYIFIVMIFLILFRLSEIWADRDRQNELVQKVQDLKEVVLKCNYSDSIHFDHIKECSWITRDDVVVGYKGALYSAYAKKYLTP